MTDDHAPRRPRPGNDFSRLRTVKETDSAPTVNEPNFTDSVSITGNFTQSEAEELAAVQLAGVDAATAAATESGGEAAAE